jgi:prepilin-type N-terminal cleavage/methylation domain-containing protein
MEQMSTARTHRAGRRRRGFTLSEVLVAVGAVAVLAVGLVEVFRATGSTLQAGKRASNLAQFATLLERQLRSDFESMSRDGFLLIRHERALDGTTVRTAPGDLTPRQRRIDQVMFLAKGQFVSDRNPAVGDLTARSTSAYVYYGHAQRRDPNDAQYLLPPGLSDANPVNRSPRLGTPNTIAQFASDWLLIRRAFLLAPPSPVGRDPIPGVPPGADADSVVQVGGQPAAPELFRSLSVLAPLPGNTLRGPAQRPDTASGLVDVIATDAASVRAIILNALPPGSPTLPEISNQVDASVPATVVANTHAWMRDALPADSANFARVRAELDPPNLLGLGLAQQTAYERADQLMLTSGVIAPRCTEFIVEWSYGEVDTNPGTPESNGRLIWYGLARDVRDPIGGQVISSVRPLQEQASLQPVRFRDGTVAARWVPAPLVMPNSGSPSVQYSYFGFIDPSWRPRLTDNAAPDFYLVDGVKQRIQQDRPPALLIDRNGDGQYQPEQGDVLLDPETIPWKWPSLIRVTITLADPIDPKIEQTFQFIFRAPGNADPSSL